MACIVLHNKAVLQRLPPPDDECTDDCNHDDHGDQGSDDDTDRDGDGAAHPAHNLIGRIARDRIAEEYFQR